MGKPVDITELVGVVAALAVPAAESRLFGEAR
jgi:hypothetical protein